MGDVPKVDVNVEASPGSPSKRGRGRPRKTVPETIADGLPTDESLIGSRKRGRPDSDMQLGFGAGGASPTSPRMFEDGQQHVKRGRGRPRKDGLPPGSVKPPPKGPVRPRGRPRKDGQPAGSVPAKDPGPKRPRGRPRKTPLLVTAQVPGTIPDVGTILSPPPPAPPMVEPPAPPMAE